MIDVRDVDVRLGGTRALDSVSVRVEEGRFVGLVGPNGAGKSTLLRTVGAIRSPDAGTVLVDGDDVHDLSSEAASRRIAAVPQSTALSFDFDVRDVVAMGRTPYRSRFRSDDGGAELVEAALDRTDTARFADRSMDAVSGGERQRVLLARALAQDAPVLLLDEPTASLDINHRIRTLELLDDLVGEEGKTVIAAIHDLNLAARYCDALVLLADGRVLDGGPPRTVLTEEALARAFDARVVVSRHPVTGSAFVTALPEATGDRDARIHVVGSGGTASELLYALSTAGYEVSIGALAEGDAALETARHLDLETVACPPFSPIGGEARARVERLIASADATVVARPVAGEMGRILDSAGGGDPRVVVEDGSADGSDATLDDDPYATVVERDEALHAVESALDPDG